MIFLGNNATYLTVFISTLSPSMPPYTDRLAKCLLIPLFCEAACVFFLCTAVNYNVSIHPEVDMFILQLNFHICSSYVSWHNRRIFAVKRTLYWAFYLPLVKTHDFTVMNINDVYMFSLSVNDQGRFTYNYRLWYYTSYCCCLSVYSLSLLV